MTIRPGKECFPRVPVLMGEDNLFSMIRNLFTLNQIYLSIFEDTAKRLKPCTMQTEIRWSMAVKEG